MGEKCYLCFRPLETCYCKYIERIETGIKFVILMHPMEAYKQKTGTGRLAHLSLVDSEIIIGVDFTDNSRLNTLLNDEQYFPVVMFPSNDAWTATSEKVLKDGSNVTLKDVIGNKTLLVVLVDGTWACAKKMLKLSTNVMALQKMSFDAGYRTEYEFKKEPAEDYISTIETCYYLIKELQESNIVERKDPSVYNSNPEPLMNVFRKMVSIQLTREKERANSGAPDRYKDAARRRKENSSS